MRMRRPELANDVIEEVIDENLARILADDYLYAEISRGLAAKTHFEDIKKVAAEIFDEIRARSELEAEKKMQAIKDSRSKEVAHFFIDRIK